MVKVDIRCTNNDNRNAARRLRSDGEARASEPPSRRPCGGGDPASTVTVTVTEPQSYESELLVGTPSGQI